MSRVMRNGHQRGAVSLGAVLVVLALGVAPAWGVSTPFTGCAGLQAALTGATSGETIELTELCTSPNTFTPPP